MSGSTVPSNHDGSTSLESRLGIATRRKFDVPVKPETYVQRQHLPKCAQCGTPHPASQWSSARLSLFNDLRLYKALHYTGRLAQIEHINIHGVRIEWNDYYANELERMEKDYRVCRGCLGPSAEPGDVHTDNEAKLTIPGFWGFTARWLFRIGLGLNRIVKWFNKRSERKV